MIPALGPIKRYLATSVGTDPTQPLSTLIRHRLVELFGIELPRSPVGAQFRGRTPTKSSKNCMIIASGPVKCYRAKFIATVHTRPFTTHIGHGLVELFGIE